MNKNKLFLVFGLLSFLYVLFAITSPLNLAINAQKQVDPTGKPIEFLGIQSAKSGLLSQINGTTYTLELNGVSNETILFSDRPDRIVESISTSDFTDNWTFGTNSFKVDPPNAVLFYEDIQTGNLDTVIIELFNPIYDMALSMLTYTIMSENTTSIGQQNEFKNVIMVVDDKPESKTDPTALCAGCGGRQCPPC